MAVFWFRRGVVFSLSYLFIIFFFYLFLFIFQGPPTVSDELVTPDVGSVVTTPETSTVASSERKVTDDSPEGQVSSETLDGQRTGGLEGSLEGFGQMSTVVCYMQPLIPEKWYVIVISVLGLVLKVLLGWVAYSACSHRREVAGLREECQRMEGDYQQQIRQTKMDLQTQLAEGFRKKTQLHQLSVQIEALSTFVIWFWYFLFCYIGDHPWRKEKEKEVSHCVGFSLCFIFVFRIGGVEDPA